MYTKGNIGSSNKNAYCDYLHQGYDSKKGYQPNHCSLLEPKQLEDEFFFNSIFMISCILIFVV